MSLLAFRSDLLKSIRDYFYSTDALEVVTPAIRDSGTSEVHLQNLEVVVEGRVRYLQTSPEFAMKILLAKHRTDIFQIGPAFRGGESGRKHLPEFLMLEWYRCNGLLAGMMDDLEALWAYLGETLGARHDLPGWQASVIRHRYAALFEEYLGVNPHRADTGELVEMCASQGMQHIGPEAGRADCLDALFSSRVEPRLLAPAVVFDYPACQSALAELKHDEDGQLVSDRFELYAGGLELANAYQELTDAVELKQRFEENNIARRSLGRPEVVADPGLLAAMTTMPGSAGIALGIDRLAMCLLGVADISEVRP